MITARVFEQAFRQPDKLAVIHNGRTLTYGHFAATIAAVRGALTQSGIGGEGVAAVVASSTLASWAMSLALRSLGLTAMPAPLTAGGPDLGSVPLRCVVASPQDRSAALVSHCAERSIPLVVPTGDGVAPFPLDLGDPSPPFGGQLLQTSGTTGSAKLVLIDPSFETRFLDERRELLGLGEGTLFNALNMPPWTGGGYKWVAATLAAGGAVILQDAAPLHDALRHPGQTQAAMVPSTLAHVLASPPDSFPRHPGLDLSIIGGAITWAQVEDAKRRITPNLFSRISATETNVFGYTRLDEPEDLIWHRPVPGVGIEIVDEDGRPLPTGVMGRLRVSTRGGPTGYYGSPEVSQTFFRDGFFYTGDLATRRADGRFALGGRTTEILNVSGHKILPAPIENRLREFWAVAGVCLVSHRGREGEERLHVVIEAPKPLDMTLVSAGLERELNIPVTLQVLWVANLPRNANGKVLREAVSRLVADR